VRWWINFVVLAIAQGGAVDFAVAEYRAALAERSLKWKVAYEVTADPPESYRIEPYKYGGAHITGGDLRGLMYGLLEAADEIRTTGRLKQVHGSAATPIRGVRLFARDCNWDDPRWRAFFQTLARDRFNRFTLIYTEPPRDFQKLRAVSQAASDFAIDFTLALWEHEPDAALDRILASCPLIRTVQIRNTTHDLDTYRGLVLKPLKAAGRRVALDPEPEFAAAAKESGIALRADLPSWPPGFDIDAPADFEQHHEFYFVCGRAAYDPKIPPGHGENPTEFRAAAQLAMLLAMADARSNDWIASIAESVHNRLEHVASAKSTPLETASALSATAGMLAKSAVPDFRLLAKMGAETAAKQRAAYEAELSASAPDPAAIPPAPKTLPRPQIVHSAVKGASQDRPIDVLVQVAGKDAISVRLHYRLVDSAETHTIEKPAAPSAGFTIPPADTDLLYFFEILNREGTGWFEPDPVTGPPYYVIRIEPRQP
jgi:hypothetical protein